MVVFRAFIVLIIAAVAAGLVVGQEAGVAGVRMVRVRGNVLAVEDSDRVKIAADDGNVYSVILIGVDAPDENQNYYKKSRKRLAELVTGKDVTVMLRTGQRNETFAIVYVGGEDIGLRMIREGYAWFSPARSQMQNEADRALYSEAEAAAKAAKSGLWADKDAIAPWISRGEKDAVPTQVDTEKPIESKPAQTARPASQPVPGRTYILGPRGGCYYLNDQGIKVYVKDKTLCNKPQ